MLALAALAAACGAPQGEAGVRGSHPPGPGDPGAVDPGAAREPQPWTDAFSERGVLLANKIRIEGPPGLLDHVAVSSEDELFLRTTRATPEGLLQTVRSRLPGTTLVRGHLDNWRLAAFDVLTVLERPGAEEVLVTAEGDAFFRKPLGTENRADRLVYRGRIGATGGAGAKD